MREEEFLNRLQAARGARRADGRAACWKLYREIGITQFLFMGWPDDEAMSFFGREILPLVRHREQTEGAA